MMASECTDRGFAEKKKKGIPIDDQAIAIVLSECGESRNSSLLQAKILSLRASLLSAQIGGAYDKKKKAKSKISKMKVGSLESFDGRFATFFLLEGDVINGRDWGVTKASVPKNVKTFIDTPYILTGNEYFPSSPYGEILDHPSLEHLVPLGLAEPGTVDLNDENLLKKFQSQFRVGMIREIFHSNIDDTWRAIVEIDEAFKDANLPPFVSPAVWKEDDSEPDQAMSKWHGLHLVGLRERPAYGDKAIKKAECFGTPERCDSQLKIASLPPMCKNKFAQIIRGLATQTARMAVLTSPTVSETQVQNVFGCKKKDEQGNCLSAKTVFGLDGDSISGVGTRMNLTDCAKRNDKGVCIETKSKKPRLK